MKAAPANQVASGGSNPDLVAAVEHLVRNDPADGLAQNRLGHPVAIEKLRGERERELGDAPVEKREPHLAAVSHRVTVGIAKEVGKAGVERLANQLPGERCVESFRRSEESREMRDRLPNIARGIRCRLAAPKCSDERHRDPDPASSPGEDHMAAFRG